MLNLFVPFFSKPADTPVIKVLAEDEGQCQFAEKLGQATRQTAAEQVSLQRQLDHRSPDAPPEIHRSSSPLERVISRRGQYLAADPAPISLEI